MIFRGKCVFDSRYAGEWVTGGYVAPEADCKKQNEGLIVGYFGGNTTITHHVDPNTVGQFTGLLDKNGKKIFEGDILRVREYENLLMNEFSDDADRFDMFSLEEIRGKLKVEYVSPVVFLDGSFQISTRDNDFDMFLACLFGDMKRSSPSFEFEVIGNIHDNLELLSTK